MTRVQVPVIICFQSLVSTTFDASPSFQGFNYQLRLALLLALRRARYNPDHLISLEVLDDIAIAGPTDNYLLQAKHTSTAIADSSPELWKSIRVWAEAVRSGAISATSCTLVLMTTGGVGASSAPRLLMSGSRDESEALRLLDKAAAESTNKALSAAFESYRLLTPKQRRELVGAIVVLDEQSDVVAIRAEIHHELRYATTRERLELLLNRLEGWWFDLAVKHLAPGNRSPIQLYTIDAEVDRLRSEYSEHNLPIEFEYAEPTSNSVDSFYERTFVAQLRLVGFDKQLIHAIHDYYRAVEQRSKWVKDNLLYLDDLTDYESRLKSEWQRQFDGMLDDLGHEATEQQMLQSGKALVKWMNDIADIRVVRDFQARFIMRGSYHVLADSMAVGWHPNFAERLGVVLTEGAS